MKNSTHVFYKSGFKYQTTENFIYKTDIIGYTYKSQFLKLTPIGVLFIMKGYAYDGPSGPAIDTPDFMRGALVHDALYQLMRQGAIPLEHRDYADALLYAICIEDGMNEIRAGYTLLGVKHFAANAADPRNKRIVTSAP